MAYPATGGAVLSAAILMMTAEIPFRFMNLLWIGAALYLLGTLLVYLILPQNKRFVTAAWIVYFCVSVLLALAVDMFMSPVQPAKMIYIVLVAAPLLYSGRPALPCGLIVGATVTSCVVAILVKRGFPNILRVDMIGTVCAGGIGVVFSCLRGRTSRKMVHVLHGMEETESTQRKNALSCEEAERCCTLFFSARANEQRCALLLIRIKEYDKLCTLLGEAQAKQTVDLIGRRAVTVLRERDIVGFRSADTLLILMKDVRNADAVEKKAAELHRLIYQIFPENSEISLQASIGAVYIKDAQITFEGALERAQEALTGSLTACDTKLIITEA